MWGFDRCWNILWQFGMWFCMYYLVFFKFLFVRCRSWGECMLLFFFSDVCFYICVVILFVSMYVRFWSLLEYFVVILYAVFFVLCSFVLIFVCVVTDTWSLLIYDFQREYEVNNALYLYVRTNQKDVSIYRNWIAWFILLMFIESDDELIEFVS